MIEVKASKVAGEGSKGTSKPPTHRPHHCAPNPHLPLGSLSAGRTVPHKVRMTERPLQWESLHDAGFFILDTGLEIFIFSGSGCNIWEIHTGNSVAKASPAYSPLLSLAAHTNCPPLTNAPHRHPHHALSLPGNA